MTQTVVLLGSGPGTGPTVGAARELASVLGSDLRGVRYHRAGTTPGAAPTGAELLIDEVPIADPVPAAVAVTQNTRVIAAVMGAADRFPSTRGDAPIVDELACAIAVPLLVVPVDSRLGDRHRHLTRALLPHEGIEPGSTRSHPFIADLEAAGVELIVLHVLDPGQHPPVIEDPSHGLEAWSHEFRSRHLHPGQRVVLREGRPAEVLAQGPEQLAADVVLLTWGQDLTPPHAEVVRASLAHPSVPLLLLPRSG